MAETFNALKKKAESKTSTTDVYQVDGSDNPIEMTLEIGAPGQKAISRVNIGTVSLANDFEGEIDMLEVGTNKSVRARRLFVTTVVTDTQASTDDTFIRLTLTGGVTGEKFWELSKTVVPNGSVLYEIKIFFFT